MIYFGAFSMHDFRCPHDTPSKELSQSLVPQTDTQKRNFFVESFDELKHDTRIIRVFHGSRARRENDVRGLHFMDLRDADLIVEKDFRISSKLTYVLLENVRERVVVINDKRLFFHAPTLTEMQADIKRVCLACKGPGRNTGHSRQSEMSDVFFRHPSRYFYKKTFFFEEGGQFTYCGRRQVV